MTAAPGSLWRNREFTLLWLSQALSDLGSAIAALAVPLLLLGSGCSPAQAGLVGTVGLAVIVLGRLPAGVLADRVDRRRVMLACDVVRLLAFGALGVLAMRGAATLAVVVLVTVIAASAQACFGTAEHSALRTIVPVAQLPAAVARNEARSYATSLAGPPIGGLLFQLARSLPFVGNAATFLLSLIGVALIRRPLQQPRAEQPAGHASALAEGLRFVFGNPFLRAVLLIAAPLNFAIQGIIFTLIVTLQRHHTPPSVIGTVETIVAVGGLLGALVAPTLQSRVRLPVLIRGICWTAAAFLACSALFAESVAAAVPIAAAVFLGPASNAALFAHQAAITPDRLQGRVVSVVITVATSVASSAPLLAGTLITAWGSAVAILFFATAVAVSAVAATVSRGIRVMGPVEELAG
ncbi:MFS transporter [Actinoplanes sp. NPDC051470]|uniref:MFS transporter n=1 Tax=Actinoplanes sp. NPDC051470 TaxID=3157224 RepID=UPI00341BB5F6